MSKPSLPSPISLWSSLGPSCLFPSFLRLRPTAAPRFHQGLAAEQRHQGQDDPAGGATPDRIQDGAVQGVREGDQDQEVQQGRASQRGRGTSGRPYTRERKNKNGKRVSLQVYSSFSLSFTMPYPFGAARPQRKHLPHGCIIRVASGRKHAIESRLNAAEGNAYSLHASMMVQECMLHTTTQRQPIANHVTQQ